jgi:Zn-dependent peptidase ImmA (M78 family)/DNA-binding XRE family transcriptional regulator
MIQGLRVRQAREFHGLTQTELAGRTGVDQSTIALVESGLRQPSVELLASIAIQTGFPPAFFRLGSPPELALGSMLFRALRSTTARERDQAQRYGEIVYETAQRMAAEVITTNPLRLPRLDGTTSPEQAAEITRASLGIAPDRPVGHLINLVERSGVIVLALPTRLPKRDAFSVWTDSAPSVPLIALSTGVPGDRLRYSVGHEVGHLVLHSAPVGTVATVEREANRFAAAFLLPESAMRQELIPPLTLSTLAELKPRWGVAMQALVMRAKELEIVTAGQASYLFKQFGLRGWRTLEPVQLVAEKPRAFRKMAELLYGTPIDARRLADDAALPLPLVHDILDAHAGLDDMPLRQASDRNNVVQFRRRPALRDEVTGN